MGEKLIMILCCLVCAIPFYTIAILGKNSKSPITFFSGDKTLKDKVKNVQSYNFEMYKLYTFYATVYIFSAISFCFYEPLGLFVLLFSSTIGIFLIYIKYKWILKKHS